MVIMVPWPTFRVRYSDYSGMSSGNLSNSDNWNAAVLKPRMNLEEWVKMGHEIWYDMMINSLHMKDGMKGWDCILGCPIATPKCGLVWNVTGHWQWRNGGHSLATFHGGRPLGYAGITLCISTLSTVPIVFITATRDRNVSWCHF